MWEFIDSLSSIYEPRFRTTDDFIIAEFPTVIEEILTLDNCCRVPANDEKFCLLITEKE